MGEIKKIISKNLVELRKKNNLTQQDLAEKLNYSDNTVSRWERGDLSPSVETLEQIAEVFNVPVENLLKENIVKNAEENEKRKRIRVLVTSLLCVCLMLFGVTIAYFYCKSFLNLNLWIMFVWFLPASFLVIFGFALFLKKRTFIFVMLTLFIWIFLASLYLQFLEYNLWLIFTLGIPAQFAWAVWCYVMPKKYRNFDKTKEGKKKEQKQ